MSGPVLLLASFVLVCGAVLAPAAAGRPRGSAPSRLTLDRVARYPPPGTRVAVDFKFSHDGRWLYSLRADGGGATRSLYRESVARGGLERLAAPPDSTAAPSREEILRRERGRIEDEGITSYLVAEKADVVVFPWRGGLYRVRPGAGPERLAGAGEGAIDPKLSPDGTRLAFVREAELHVLDIASGRAMPLTTGARPGVTHGLAEYIAQEEMDRASGHWWSPDGAFLAYTEVDETRIPIYPIVHQGAPRWEVEEHRYPFAGGPNAMVRLGVVPAAGGATVWLPLAPAGEDHYLARVAWTPGGDVLAIVQRRDQQTLRLLRFDPVAGRATTLLTESSGTWIELHDDLKPLRDGRFLWSSEETGFRHLELRDADGALVRRLTSGSWPVDRIEGVDEAAGLVYFSAASDGPLDRPILRVSLEGGAIEKVAAEAGFHEATVSADGGVFVDLHDALATPPHAVLRDRGGALLRVLDANDDPEVRALALPPPKLVTVPAADGTLLHGALYLPRRPPQGRKLPALVRVYGGPTAQSVTNRWELTRDLRAQYLAEHGYVVFRLDNRGTPRRGRAFQTTLDHRLGSVEVEDQIAGTRWLARLPYVDGTRIGVYGWSYGGYVAALCLLEAPRLFRAGVAGAPVTDWDGYDTHYTERYLGLPQDNAEAYRRSSVLARAGRLEVPLLLVHGMVDENVHFRHTARLINALTAAGKPYDLQVFPDERHLPRGADDRRYMEERLVAHFDRYLRQDERSAQK